MFITFEGIEGVGKTTAVKGLTEYLSQQQIPYIVTREPGGTAFAESIRQLLLTPNTESIDANTELLLLFAARNQHITQCIAPALQNNQWVICDRFVDASYAYQGGGRGINTATIDNLVTQFVSVKPDLTFWLDAPVAVALQRTMARGNLDRFEQEKHTFFERAQQAYSNRCAQEPNRIKQIDATQDAEHVLKSILSYIEALPNINVKAPFK